LDKAGEGMDNINVKSKGARIADMFAGAASGITETVSGFMLIENGIASLTAKLKTGEDTWGDWISAAMAVLPGAM
jgi:hypothetical protein